MSVVCLSIANNKYRIGCENGQEERLHGLGEMIDARAAEILDRIGPMGEQLLLVTLCVVLADEIESGSEADLQEILDKVREIKRKLK